MTQILPRYTDPHIHHDPLETWLAQREAAETAAREAINNGHTTDLADPADLRGIPVIARGVGGTSPGTNPLSAYITAENRAERHRSTIAA